MSAILHHLPTNRSSQTWIQNNQFHGELVAMTNFSFLRGASHPDEMVVTAASLGMKAIGIADRNTLAGVVRAHMAARRVREQGQSIQLLVGSRLVTVDGQECVVYPRNREAYGRLSQLLTKGNRRAPKGECHLWIEDFKDLGDGHCVIYLPSASLPQEDIVLESLVDLFPDTVWIGATCRYGGADARRLLRLQALGQAYNVPLLATNDAYYHIPERRILQDVLTCIREHVRIDDAGFRLRGNAEAHLKHGAEMDRLFRDYPISLTETKQLATLVTFSLDELSYQYPEETAGLSATPQEELVRLTWDGAREKLNLTRRISVGEPSEHGKVREILKHELSLIEQLDYAPYFLTVYDLVRFAVSNDILCQGRGSAANSVVCFCLGITAVNPLEVDLLFERFISAERNQPPDIDVDFEHERREEVIQYIYEKYGRDRAGIAATVITYRARSAIREVGKVMGLSPDTVDALAGTVWGWSSSGIKDEHIVELGLDPNSERLHMSVELARNLMGFPRHLSQHVGGFVMTRMPLDTIVPVMNAAMDGRTNVEWDKDDLDALGMLKVDVLALGMLTCLAKCFDLLKTYYKRPMTLAEVPREDKGVYDMICRADTIGVFQIESRAQMSMLPRLKPRTFYDLVIEISIVRPGPIQGDMVHPYLRRRNGEEPVSFPSKELEEVLGKTMGVPLFQEQAMKIAIVAAGFTPAEADQLRRAMATFRKTGTIHTFESKMVDGMVARGYDRDFAERCFQQIEGFGEYGFPESHAASFSILAYASAWLKRYYPSVFACALLNSQPMGFYAPAQIVRDLKDHGGEIRPPDINCSFWDASLEKGQSDYALRLGFRQIKGLRPELVEKLTKLRGDGYDSVRDVWLRTGFTVAVLERLAHADCFAGLGLTRREALWAVRALGEAPLPLFAAMGVDEQDGEPEVHLPSMLSGEEVVQDYASMRLTLRSHPMSFFREQAVAEGYVTHDRLADLPDGRMVRISGLVLVRQRPGTAKGVIFITLEDETGVANLIVWPKVFEEFRRIILSSRMIAVKGKLQKEGRKDDGMVIHVVVDEILDLSQHLVSLAQQGTVTDLDVYARADEVKKPGVDSREISLTRRLDEHKQARQKLPPTSTTGSLRTRMENAQSILPARAVKLPPSRDFH